MLHCVIMAGGIGTRFWPLSLQTRPKQFLSLTGETSLLQAAFNLVQPWIPPDRTWVVTNRKFADQTHEQLPGVSVGRILQEPCGRNTAPCVGLAALCLLEQDPDAVMLVMSADHVISPAAAFEHDVRLALQLIEEDPGRLVLFGVRPTYPATGFGYIEHSAPLTPGAFGVKSFREKPDQLTANRYLAEMSYFWNCGIFVWRAADVLRLLEQYEPEMAAALQSLKPHIGQRSWDEALATVFPQMKSISIDYAVLEREQNIAVVEATFSWDDAGSWEAMQRLHGADFAGNTVIGKHVGIDTSNCIIRSTSDHLITTIGLENFVVVQTPAATLIARRDDENGIRKLIAAIQEQGLTEFL